MPTGQYTAADVAAPPQQGSYSLADVDLSSNPKGEGVYQMKGQDGKTVGIPYSNVTAAMGQGNYFANASDQQRFEKDNAADRKQNDAYIKGLTPSAGGIAEGAVNEAGNMAKGAASLVAKPANVGELALGPALPAYRAVKSYAQSAATGLGQAASYANSGQPIRAAATAVGAVNPLSAGPTATINNRVDQGAPISRLKLRVR
jgi:hypothetical protein